MDRPSIAGFSRRSAAGGSPEGWNRAATQDVIKGRARAWRLGLVMVDRYIGWGAWGELLRLRRSAMNSADPTGLWFIVTNGYPQAQSAKRARLTLITVASHMRTSAHSFGGVILQLHTKAEGAWRTERRRCPVKGRRSGLGWRNDSLQTPGTRGMSLACIGVSWSRFSRCHFRTSDSGPCPLPSS